MRAHTLDMTVGSPARLLLRFSLPLFVGNLFQQVYNLADTAIAGHLLGDAALSQIGATAALYSLITTLAFGLNSGFALSVSRHFGANDRKRMEQSVCWMVTLSALCAAVMTAVFLLSRFALADAMQIPADTREGALAYLTVILAGIPLTMAYNLESSLMQSVGNSVTPLLFLVFSSILNIALDLLFMGPLGLGVGGAAAATVLAQGISAALGLFYILRREPDLHFGRDALRVPRGFVPDMFFTGLSMALMSAIYSIGRHFAGQHQRAGQRLHRRSGRRPPPCRIVLHAGRGAGRKRRDVFQPKLRRKPPPPHRAGSVGRAGDLRRVVAVRAGVHLHRRARGHPAHHRQHEPRRAGKRAALSACEHPDGAADGCGRHRAQRAARHEAYRRAVDLQHDGAGLQGVFQL